MEKLIEPEWRDTGEFVEDDEKVALDIISATEDSMEFDVVEFEWAVIRALIDYWLNDKHGRRRQDCA